MKIVFKKDSGWKKFEKALGPRRFNQILSKNMNRALKINCLIMVAKTREVIKEGNLEANAPMTIAVKGENKPLVGYKAGATLFGSITHAIQGDFGFVGVLKSDNNYSIAETLHEGKAIKVTPAMRGLFLALWQAGKGKLDPNKLTGAARDMYEQSNTAWLPLKPTTTAIIIPSRPFIANAFLKTENRKLVENNFERALAKTFSEMASA